MIISESHKFIFIHNPKCAGTSFRHLLNEFETRGDYYWLFDEIDNRKIDKAHLPLNILRKFSPEDFKLLNSYFVFGFVRNPYARALSAFNETNQSIYKNFKEKSISLSEYSSEVNNFIHQLTKKNVIGWNIKYRHFVTQTSMFWLEGKRYADLIIKVEEMNDRLMQLSIFLPEVAIKINNNLVTINERSIGSSPEQIFDLKSIERINDIYYKDFIAFGYPMIGK